MFIINRHISKILFTIWTGIVKGDLMNNINGDITTRDLDNSKSGDDAMHFDSNLLWGFLLESLGSFGLKDTILVVAPIDRYASIISITSFV